MNFRRLLFIFGFAIIVLLLGFAWYWVFVRSPDIGTDNQTNQFGPGGVPDIGTGVTPVDITDEEPEQLPFENLLNEKVARVANGGLTLVNEVTKTEAKGLTAGRQGLQFYDKAKQQFFRVSADGTLSLLTDQKFFNVDKVTWDPSSDKAILEYPDGNNILYDFRQNKQVTLPPELESFSFDRTGENIAASWIGGAPENNWIVSANSDGSGMRLIEPLGDQAHNTEIGYSPDSQVVALHRKSTGLNEQEVFPISAQGENLRSFTVQGSGFTSDWSPQGTSLIYSVYNEETDYLPNLWITGGQTGQLGDLKVSLNLNTWPDKCTFSGENTLFCAVPQGLPRGVGLFPDLANDYTDNFYRVDLNTGVRTLLASPIGQNGGYTANNLFLSPDGSILYFTDQQTGYLQNIRLR